MKLTVSVPGDTAFYLQKAAERDKMPLEKKASQLLKLGLETEEDKLLATIAFERMKNSKGYISHEKFWEKVF